MITGQNRFELGRKNRKNSTRTVNRAMEPMYCLFFKLLNVFVMINTSLLITKEKKSNGETLEHICKT